MSNLISAPLGNVLDKLLERGTRKRYQSATAVLQDLAVTVSVSDDVDYGAIASRLEIRLSQMTVAATVAAIVGVVATVGTQLDVINFFPPINQPQIVHTQEPNQPPKVSVPKLETEQKPVRTEKLAEDQGLSIVSTIGRIGLILMVLATAVMGIRAYRKNKDMLHGFHIKFVATIFFFVLSLLK